MEADAEAYSRLNTPQYDAGCSFIQTLNISEGYKVLDIGSGTGELTNFIACLVGPHGEVVGVDPDEARVKIAQEKFKDVPNLTFIVGDSSSKLPHDEEQYYDLHFSSSVFHWLSGDEKKLYLKKAYQCLKEGGRLALFVSLKSELSSPEPADKAGYEALSEVEYKKICEDHGFRIVATQTVPFVSRHSNYEEFEAWFRATVHLNLSDFDPAFVKVLLEKTVEIEADGSVKFELANGMIRIISEKQ